MSAPKLLSVLLQYPTEELLAATDELAETAAELGQDGILRFLAGWRGRTLLELQDEYTRTFDFDRRSSLHLTYHAHGDRRQRGLELVRLKRRFAEAGLELAGGELSDYLPVLLEFASLAPGAQGQALLAEHREAIELVRSSLRDRGSPYAELLDAVVSSLPRLTAAQRARIERLALEGPPAELVGLEPFGAEGGTATPAGIGLGS